LFELILMVKLISFTKTCLLIVVGGILNIVKLKNQGLSGKKKYYIDNHLFFGRV